MDAKAFEGLFELQFDAVYGYLARRVGPDLGRDLAAETFAQAFAGRRRFDPRRGELRPWLFGIAQNLLRRHYRDEERRLDALARVDLPSENVPPEEPRLASALALLAAEESATRCSCMRGPTCPTRRLRTRWGFLLAPSARACTAPALACVRR